MGVVGASEGEDDASSVGSWSEDSRAQMPGFWDDTASVVSWSSFGDGAAPVSAIDGDGQSTSKGLPVHPPLDDLLIPPDEHIRILLRSLSKGFPASLENNECRWLALQTSASASDQPQHKIIAVRQSEKDVRFSMRLPFVANESGITSALLLELYYDPSGDNLILLNRSELPIVLERTSHFSGIPRNQQYQINPGHTKSLELSTWKVSVRNIDIFELRIIEREHVKKVETGPFPPARLWNSKLPSIEGNPVLELGLGETALIPSGGEGRSYSLTNHGIQQSNALESVYKATSSLYSTAHPILVKVQKTRLKTGTGNGPSLDIQQERNVVRQAGIWLRELTSLGALEHTNIISLLGGDGRYLSLYMEHIQAANLSHRETWRDRQSDHFLGSRTDAVSILRDISSALLYLLGRNLVHNDVKPSNILYSRERGAVLCGFALSNSVSQPSTVGGTPYYIPPEFVGRKLRGPAGDVWALGVTLLYLLGKLPLPDTRGKDTNQMRLYWMIADVNKASARSGFNAGSLSALDQMRMWLSEVDKARAKLDKGDILDSVVSDMLNPNPNSRLTVAKLHERLLDLPTGPSVESPSPSGTGEVDPREARPGPLVTREELSNIVEILSGQIQGVLLQILGSDVLVPLSDALPHLLEELGVHVGSDTQLPAARLRLMCILHELGKHIPTKSFVTTDGDLLFNATHAPDYYLYYGGSRPHEPIWDSLLDILLDIAGFRLPFGDGGTLDNKTLAKLLGGQSWAMHWFVSSIRREIGLDVAGERDARRLIRSGVLARLRAVPGEDGLGLLKTYDTTFSVNCDLVSFFERKQYDGPPEEMLSRVITLSGNRNAVQAMTTLEYIQQVWPRHGLQLISSLERMLSSNQAKGKTSDASLGANSISASMDGHSLSVRVIGTAYFVAEVGEALGWLSASLQMSDRDIGPRDIAKAEVYLRPGDPLEQITMFRIDIHITKLDQDDANLPTTSNCWRDLFRNPVVVSGYPIRRRKQPGTGLETSFDIMASLVRARGLVNFRDRTFLKGFSSMLVASKAEGDIVFWHLFFNEDKSHVTYTDKRLEKLLKHPPAGLDLDGLESMRHIVGWCTNVKNYVGAPDAEYSIRWSGLPKPNQKCAFDKVSISGGKFISAGISCSIGLKDRPIHINVDDYIGMLLTISTRYFVFYDVGDRRAWLVDGASTLLHLLRASIKHYQDDARLRLIFCFDSDDFVEADEPYTGGDAAFKVLSNVDNQDLPLYPKSHEIWDEETRKTRERIEHVSKRKSTYLRVRDRVGQICTVLEQIIAHQDDDMNGVGFRLKYTPRLQLEGFDFMGVATNQGTLWPKVATLHATGAGWVDFTRALHAVTLFGNGFGDLFQPTEAQESCRSCGWNTNLPVGKDYLAVCATELEEIIKMSGEKTCVPWRLVDDIHWHVPDKLHEPCRCGARRSHDRVQVLIPTSFPKLWGRGFASPSALAPGSAVVFGHSWILPLRWKARINREEPDNVVPDEEHSLLEQRRVVEPSTTERQPAPPATVDQTQLPVGTLYAQENQPFATQSTPWRAIESLETPDTDMEDLQVADLRALGGLDAERENDRSALSSSDDIFHEKIRRKRGHSQLRMNSMDTVSGQ